MMETLDKLYLELSQITKAKTKREIDLEKKISELKDLLAECGELLCSHHRYGFNMELYSMCPICTVNGTRKYPNDIFGRIGKAIQS